MITSWQHVTRRMSTLFGALCLIVLLTACGGGSGSGSATPTAQAPTATPTTAPTPTPAVQLQTYTGKGFTIEYPQNWKAQSSQAGVVFSDAQQLHTLTVAVAPNPGGIASPDKEADAALSLLEKSGGISSAQPANLPATTTVGGESWVQRGITGSAMINGTAVPGELVVLVDNHPAQSPSTQAFEIYYGGPSVDFQQQNSLVFQPMLQTFKFTA